MEILNSYTTKDKGYPTLHVQTDRGTLHLGIEQKWLDRYGLLFTGSGNENTFPPVRLPPDPADARGEIILRGYTDEPRLLALFHKWYADLHEEGR